MLTTLLLSALLANGPGAIATVDDTNSHGAVGDAKLSLDEAIQLANGTLALTSLSAQELARISGSGAVTTVRIDAALSTDQVNMNGHRRQSGIASGHRFVHDLRCGVIVVA